MRLFNFFNKKNPRIERKAQTSEIVWPLPQGSFIEYALGYGGKLSAEKAMYYYRTNSTIATAVDKIAGKFEQIEPVLMRRDGKMLNKHPLLDLLRDPNPFDTWQDFAGKLSRHYLIKCDSHVALLGNVKRPPLEMYALKPQNVGVTQGADYFPAGYYVTVGPGRGHYLRAEAGRRISYIDGNMRELYHIMGFSSRADELEGDSKIEAAALETLQQIKGRTHNLSLLENGGRLSLIASFKDPDGIDDDEHQARKRRLNEDLGGSSNAGKIAVISGAEVDITEAGVNNKDMDYALLDKVASESIYMRYEIPLPLVSNDASTYNNMEQALFDFYENTVLPHADTIFSGLSKVLLPRYGIDSNEMTITYNPESINTLIRQKLIEIKTRREINIETINELRSLLPNRESIDKGGDVLYQPATLVPVGDDLFTGDNLSPEELAAQLAKEAGVDE
jgi:HK97 family phage portal protein